MGSTASIFRVEQCGKQHKEQAKLLSLVYSGFLKTEAVRSPRNIYEIIPDYTAYDPRLPVYGERRNRNITKNVQNAGSTSQNLILIKYNNRTKSKSLNFNPGVPEHGKSSITIREQRSIS
jgi:hypothetical protein